MLAFGGEAVAAGFDDAQFLQAEAVADHRDEVLALVGDAETRGILAVRTDAEGNDFLHHFREDGHQVAVAEAEHGVQVHGGAGLRQAGDDHALGGALGEQGLGHLPDGLA
ncbi:hypothetical protein D3C81_1937520 [compost metagenome]